MNLEVAPKDDTLGGVHRFMSSSEPCTWKYRACGWNGEKDLAHNSGACDLGCLVILTTNVSYWRITYRQGDLVHSALDPVDLRSGTLTSG